MAVWLAVIIFIVAVVAKLRPPGQFPQNSILTVRERAPVSEIAKYLYDQHAISSPLLFELAVKIFNPHNGVLSGSYYFKEPRNLITVAYRITKGEYGLNPLVVTIPEGNSISQIAEIISKTLPEFDADKFVELAQKVEGYLFPDTYYFLPDASPKDVIKTMRENFDTKITSLESEIRFFGKPLSDVITMASYLEEEARLMQTRRMVAGILWKRLDEGIPLQIDSTFQYINGKNTFQLTLDDLQIDSPHNTYKYKGLTPTPISNPGLDAILAAVTPIESLYYFFLSDKEGVMHYAVTHDQHVSNKQRYLR